MWGWDDECAAEMLTCPAFPQDQTPWQHEGVGAEAGAGVGAGAAAATAANAAAAW